MGSSKNAWLWSKKCILAEIKVAKVKIPLLRYFVPPPDFFQVRRGPCLGFVWPGWDSEPGAKMWTGPIGIEADDYGFHWNAMHWLMAISEKFRTGWWCVQSLEVLNHFHLTVDHYEASPRRRGRSEAGHLLTGHWVPPAPRTPARTPARSPSSATCTTTAPSKPSGAPTVFSEYFPITKQASIADCIVFVL